MTKTLTKDRIHGLLLAGCAAGALMLAASAASAGECPAGKAGHNDLADAAMAPAGVTDNVLSSIDVSQAPVNASERMFRLRRLEVQPGGVVPLHDHADRPALIYVVSGSITEFNTGCTVGIVHKAGEAAQESIGLMHWWKNTGKEVAVLLSADLLHTTADDGHTM